MKGISTIARTSFILAVAVVLCLALASVASASIPEATGNEWNGPAVTTQTEVAQFKTGADSGVGQIVQAPAAQPAGESGFSTTVVVAIVLAAAAACALVVFGLMRRRTHPRAAKVSSLPGPATSRQHTKAA